MEVRQQSVAVSSLLHHAGSEGQAQALSHLTTLAASRSTTRSLTEPGAHGFGWLASQQASGVFLGCPSRAVIRGGCHCSAFSNPGLQAHTASAPWRWRFLSRTPRGCLRTEITLADPTYARQATLTLDHINMSVPSQEYGIFRLYPLYCESFLLFRLFVLRQGFASSEPG